MAVLAFNVLQPLRDRAAAFNGPSQFSLAELIFLILSIAVLDGVHFLIYPSSNANSSIVIAIILSAIWTLWWFLGIQTVSRLRITSLLQRFLIAGILFPIVYTSALADVYLYITRGMTFTCAGFMPAQLFLLWLCSRIVTKIIRGLPNPESHD